MTRSPDPRFIAPETLGSMNEKELKDLEQDLQGASSWDVATRYHEFKSRTKNQKLAHHLRKISAAAILERAREVVGSVVRPVEQKSAPWPDLPPHAQEADLDLDETIENSPMGVTSAQDIWMVYPSHRRQSIILTVDTSLSMTGEKLALTAVALAVVLLEFPDDPIGMIAFENEARILKAPDEFISIEQLLERFLDVPAQGYTHLEAGMKAALRLTQATQVSGRGKPPSVVLLTDGKYTAGKDPTYLAGRFPHLVVLKMGKERASLDLCKDLARRGRGVLREVEELEALPQVMYAAVKDLLRGRSII